MAFDFAIKQGMTFLAENKVSKEKHEIVFLGLSPTGKMQKWGNITLDGVEWLTEEEKQAKWELIEFLGF
jgi:hypothetical protein